LRLTSAFASHEKVSTFTLKIFPPFAFLWSFSYAARYIFMSGFYLENLSTFVKGCIFCALKIFPPFI
jgi:hypothetical protein